MSCFSGGDGRLLSLLKKALTIAGSDPSGGAGVQADLKTFAVFKVYGISVLTAVTAQNTRGVQGVFPLSAEFVARQLDSILKDMGADAAKTGMLARAEIVEVIAYKLGEYRIPHLVVDPVFTAKGGEILLEEGARKVLSSKLLPLAELVTPNLEEAAVLSGLEVKTLEQMKQAASVIRESGVEYVLITGGHLNGEPVDLLYDGEQFLEFESERVASREAHGTGCTLSAAITAGLALGMEVEEAVRAAKRYLAQVIAHPLQIGGGYRVLDHFIGL